jgi:PPOX class probable F420-dependent enzyme
MSHDEVTGFLRGRHVVNVATIGPDGNVHLVALWYGFIGSHLAFETFAKSQKVQNLRREPRITALVEDGEHYEELRGVELVGRAVIHDDEATLLDVAAQVVTRYWGVTDPEQVAAQAASLARKRVAIEIVPTNIVSWDHRKLGGRY